MNAYELIDRRNFTDEDIQYGRLLAIVGSEVQAELFETEYPLGKNIRIAGHQFRIIGLLNQKGSIFGQSLDEFVLIPYTTALGMYGGDRNIDIQVKLQLWILLRPRWMKLLE